MRRTVLTRAAGAAVAVGAAVAAALVVGLEGRLEADGTRALRVAKMVPTKCDTDGGPVTCDLAVKFLGAAFEYAWNQTVESTPLDCGAGKPATLAIEVVYEYNDGVFFFTASDAAKAKWPACVRDGFAPKAEKMLREVYERVWAIDPRIDVRSYHKLTLSLR